MHGLHPEQLILAPHGTGKDTDPVLGKAGAGIAGILDGVPHGFEEDPFLRVDELGLAW